MMFNIVSLIGKMWFVVYFLSFFVPYVFGCGETINAQTGQIQSANYPRNYPDGQDCTWAVTVSGASIKVTFNTEFGIEEAGGCGYDYVQLYSITSRGASNIGKYCGGQSPGVKLVPSNRMMVKFKSDGSVNEKGFSVNFTAVVNGGWGGWSNFENVGQCSTTCGTGSQRQTRTRQCDNPAPLGGGSQCSGSTTEDQAVACKLRECPVHGGWSVWSSYEPGQCSVSCGSGYRNETSSRDCNNPTPANGGDDCAGDDVRTREITCSMDPCPIHGGWSPWSNYEPGQCSVSCGSGYQNETSSRDCNNPTPANGGEDCVGDDVRTSLRTCSMDPCPADTVAYSEMALRQNASILEYCRTSMACLGGATAGILGLTGLYGFAFYFITSFLFSVMVLIKAGSRWNNYFVSRKILFTNGFLGGLFTYVLSWTFLYGMVHVY